MTRRESIYLILLGFPDEREDDENLLWLRSQRNKVERFCNEYCLSIGGLLVLPAPYSPIMENFFRRIKSNYDEKGYSPLFESLRVDLNESEFTKILRLILKQIQLKLENYLNMLEKEEVRKNNLLMDIFRETAKTNELILIFHLDKVFPNDSAKIRDLIGILDEKLSEFRIQILEKVEVREL